MMQRKVDELEKENEALRAQLAIYTQQLDYVSYPNSAKLTFCPDIYYNRSTGTVSSTTVHQTRNSAAISIVNHSIYYYSFN